MGERRSVSRTRGDGHGARSPRERSPRHSYHDASLEQPARKQRRLADSRTDDRVRSESVRGARDRDDDYYERRKEKPRETERERDRDRDRDRPKPRDRDAEGAHDKDRDRGAGRGNDRDHDRDFDRQKSRTSQRPRDEFKPRSVARRDASHPSGEESRKDENQAKEKTSDVKIDESKLEKLRLLREKKKKLKESGSTESVTQPPSLVEGVKSGDLTRVVVSGLETISSSVPDTDADRALLGFAAEQETPRETGDTADIPMAGAEPEAVSDEDDAEINNEEENVAPVSGDPLLAVQAAHVAEGGPTIPEPAGDGGAAKRKRSRRNRGKFKGLVPAEGEDLLDCYMNRVNAEAQAAVDRTVNKLEKRKQFDEKKREAELQKKLIGDATLGDEDDEKLHKTFLSELKTFANQPLEKQAENAKEMLALQDLEGNDFESDEEDTLPTDGPAAEAGPKKKADEGDEGDDRVERVVGFDDKCAIVEGGAVEYFNDALAIKEPTEGYFELKEKYGNKKELQPVNHDKMDYMPFEKKLYVQVREISDLKDHQVEAFRKSHGDIRVRGRQCPRPISTFTQCGLPETILQALERFGFDKPFPIQLQTIPALMNGRDVVGIAETGSGKTLAYILPMVRHINAQPRTKEGQKPIALVLGPTRELTHQLANQTRKFASLVDLRVVTAYGGVGIGTQLSQIKRGCEIVVGTPGRLTDILTTNNGRILSLSRVSFVVLDEADRLFDMGFGPQVIAILNNIQPKRQVAMFSATFPAGVERLAMTLMKHPLEIVVGAKGRSAANVIQKVEVLNHSEKFGRLLYHLGHWYEHGESTVVFVGTQIEADSLAVDLRMSGYPCLVLHGGMPQDERDSAIRDFKNKEQTILVATSIASRGLDVKSVVLVLNYTAPDHMEDYVHRIGRTGRAGRMGVAITFVTPEEAEKAEDVLRVMEQSEAEIPQSLRDLVETSTSKTFEKSKTTLKGFKGKGFKFNKSETSELEAAKTAAKRELGLVDIEEDTQVDEPPENPMAPLDLPIGTSADGTIQPSPPPVGPPGVSPAPPGVAGAPVPSPTAGVDLEANAVQLANKAVENITDPVQRANQIKLLMPLMRNLAKQQQNMTALQNAQQQQQQQQGPIPSAVPSVPVPAAQPRAGTTTHDVSALVSRALHRVHTTGLPTGSALVAYGGGRGLTGMGKSRHETLSAILQSAASAPSGPIVPRGGIVGLSSQAYQDPTTGHYVDEFVINNYPAQVRQKVSHKEVSTRISEETGATIQIKGVYTDQERKRLHPYEFQGVRELYVEISAPTAVAVQRARHEMKSLAEQIAIRQLNLPGNR